MNKDDLDDIKKKIDGLTDKVETKLDGMDRKEKTILGMVVLIALGVFAGFFGG